MAKSKKTEPRNLKVVEDDSVIEITISRPEVRNAFNPGMIQEITKTFQSLSKRKDIRAIVLRGEGSVFCAGADLNWMKEMAEYSLVKNKKDSEELFEMFNSIAECSHPVMGIIQGSAFGGGLGLVACCDIVIAEEQSQFCFSEVKLGLVPAVISHFVLKKTSLGLITPWMLVGRAFSAKEAQFLGLVHLIAKASELDSLKNILLNQFGEAGPEAVRETKRLLRSVPSLPLAKAKLETTKCIAARRVSKEGQEGLQSFLEKRTPAWKRSWRVRS